MNMMIHHPRITDTVSDNSLLNVLMTNNHWSREIAEIITTFIFDFSFFQIFRVFLCWNVFNNYLKQLVWFSSCSLNERGDNWFNWEDIKNNVSHPHLSSNYLVSRPVYKSHPGQTRPIKDCVERLDLSMTAHDSTWNIRTLNFIKLYYYI